MKNYTTIAAIFVLMGTLLLTACKPAPTEALPEALRPVKTMTVGGQMGASSMQFSAEIKPRIESRLAFRVGGKVIERTVELGTRVRKGQILMRLDATDLQLATNASLAQVAAAKANDDVAQAALKRAQELVKQNFISSGALEQAIGQANVTKAALQAAQANTALSSNSAQYGVLQADADGVVTALEAEVGQVVAAGTPVLRMTAGAEKDVVFSVAESALPAMKRGLSLSVQLWSEPSEKLNAIVRDVSVAADTVSRTYVVKAALKDLKNAAPLGATATAEVLTGLSAKGGQTIEIPLSSVIEVQGKTFVWVVESVANVSVIKRRSVVIANNLPAGSSLDALVTVREGLVQGMQIAVAGVHVLAEGQKVRAQNVSVKE
jgi:RND family efflux transporter MFP subunit